MRLSCTICYELFIPTDDVHAAPCGHILHYKCWSGWLQRSENCPYCRKPTRLHQLFKLCFNLGEGDDYSTLSNRYDALRCDLSCKIKDCEAAEKQLKLKSEENIKLKRELQKFKTENGELRKSSGSRGSEGAAGVSFGRKFPDSLEEWQKVATETTKKERELQEEIIKLKNKAKELEKKKSQNAVDKIYTETDMEPMRVYEMIVLNLKHGIHEYEEMKKNNEFLKSLKVYTDQVDSTTDLWYDVDDEPAKYVELFKDVKRFLSQKTRREEELSLCPRGCVLEISGIPKGSDLSWQDIRRAVESFDVDVAFVTFNPGDEVAFVRLEGHEAPAHRVANKVNGGWGLEMEVGVYWLRFRSLQGQEETNFLRSSLEARDRRNRERFMRRRGYGDADEDQKTFLDLCMDMVAEAKTE